MEAWTKFDATDEGHPQLRIGTSDAEELQIRLVLNSGEKTVDYVLFKTDVLSGTADKGAYKFDVDGTVILTIDDDGLELNGDLIADNLGLTGDRITKLWATAVEVTTAAGLTIGGAQIDSDDLADVSSIAKLDESETVTESWIFGKSVYITEQASAESDTSGDGQFWVKDDAPNIPMFTNDDGTDFEISLVGTGHASMYWNANATVITPSEAAYPMVAVNLTAGPILTGFTFVSSGLSGVISDTANNGGLLRITDVAHELATGDIVMLHGMGDSDHNGVTHITRIDNDTYDCDDISYNSASDTGLWNEPDYLLVSADGAGEYHLQWNVSCTKGAGATATITWEPYKNATILSEAIMQRQLPGTDQGVIYGQTFVTVVSGDRLFLTVTNETNTNTVLHKYGNFLLTRR